MTQLRGELVLAQKALGAECLREIGLEHFDRDIAIVLDVVREIHGGHAAGAEFAFNAIAVGQRRRESNLRRTYFANPVTGATQMLLCGSCNVKYNRPACSAILRALSA